MGRDEIRAKVTALLAEIVDEPGLRLTDASQAKDHAWWDSLNHLKLLVALEEELGIEFQLNDISNPQNVGELVDMIQGRI